MSKNFSSLTIVGGLLLLLSCGGQIQESSPELDTLQSEVKGGKCGGGKGKSYVSRDPNECAAILFLCAEGYQPFFNACGCGCVVSPTPSICDDPNRTYVSKDPNQCATIRFFCESGTAFSDECGCGCVN